MKFGFEIECNRIRKSLNNSISTKHNQYFFIYSLFRVYTGVNTTLIFGEINVNYSKKLVIMISDEEYGD
jgi:hypothetical protein